MNDWEAIINENISNYIAGYNFKDFDIKEFKKDLNKIIGITPAVKPKWKTTERVNELKKAAGVEDFIEITEKIQSIEIVFVDADDKPYNLQFLL